MSDDKERLLTAQWVFERTLGWLAAAEIKVGVVVTIDIALLGSIGAAFSSAQLATLTVWAYFWAISASVFAAAGIFCGAMAILPRLDGPSKSLLFFGRVKSLDSTEYFERFKSSTAPQLLEDWTAQIHRNAQIASDKFIWVRAGMCWSFLAVAPWFAGILCLLRK